MKNKKIFTLIIVVLIIVATLGGFIITKKVIEPNQEKIYEQKKEEATRLAPSIITKSIVILKNEKLPTDISDYILAMPEEVNFDDLKLDTNSVNADTVGTYEYTITYFEQRCSGTVIIVETEEEKEKILNEISKEQEETINNITNEEVSREENDNNDSKNNSTENNTNNSKIDENKDNNDDENEEDDENDSIVIEPSGTTLSTPDYKIVSYATIANQDTTGASEPELEGYNGELLFKFEKPIVLDAIGTASFHNFRNTERKKLREYSLLKAKEIYGEDKGYCVQYDETIYARNKSGAIVGVIGKAVIGMLDEMGACYTDNRTIYLNNQILMYQDDAEVNFKNK